MAVHCGPGGVTPGAGWRAWPRAPCPAADAACCCGALQEFLPAVFALQMALGLAYPRAAAALGLAWSLGRVVYALGECTRCRRRYCRRRCCCCEIRPAAAAATIAWQRPNCLLLWAPRPVLALPQATAQETRTNASPVSPSACLCTRLSSSSQPWWGCVQPWACELAGRLSSSGS
jgi:hypothetical protein